MYYQDQLEQGALCFFNVDIKLEGIKTIQLNDCNMEDKVYSYFQWWRELVLWPKVIIWLFIESILLLFKFKVRLA